MRAPADARADAGADGAPAAGAVPAAPHAPTAPHAAQDMCAPAAAHDEDGVAPQPALLDAATCAALAALHTDDAAFRSRVIMARHGFGRGTYGYFAYPLPPLVATLRTQLYPPLAEVASR